MDTRKRSWAKSITWRLIGIAIMPPIILYAARLFDNDAAKIALWSTVVFHGVRIVLYYFHERMWLRIKWGNGDKT